MSRSNRETQNRTNILFSVQEMKFQIPQSDDVHLFKKKKELYCSIAKRKEKSNAL